MASVSACLSGNCGEGEYSWWGSVPVSVYRGELDLIKHCNESNEITLTSVDTVQCLHNSLLALC